MLALEYMRSLTTAGIQFDVEKSYLALYGSLAAFGLAANIALANMRAKDAGLPGWTVSLLLVPFLGIAALVAFLAVPSVEDRKREAEARKTPEDRLNEREAQIKARENALDREAERREREAALAEREIALQAREALVAQRESAARVVNRVPRSSE